MFSPFEVACLDIQGKAAGLPVADLLGGAVRDEVPFSAYLFYKWAGHPGQQPDELGEALDPDGIVAQARRLVDAYGFTALKLKGAGVVSHIIYEKDKLTYRSEIDQMMRSGPDFLYLNGYAPDTVVVLRDLFKANIDLPKFAQSYAVPQKTLDAIPPEVSARLYTGQPSADIDGQAFKLATQRLGFEPDSYEAQATDWASLVILTVAAAKEATGVALRENVRKISQGAGQKVYMAVEGLKLLAEGKDINYEGASGPCDFTDIGDIQGCCDELEELLRRIHFST